MFDSFICPAKNYHSVIFHNTDPRKILSVSKWQCVQRRPVQDLRCIFVRGRIVRLCSFYLKSENKEEKCVLTKSSRLPGVETTGRITLVQHGPFAVDADYQERNSKNTDTSLLSVVLN